MRIGQLTSMNWERGQTEARHFLTVDNFPYATDWSKPKSFPTKDPLTDSLSTSPPPPPSGLRILFNNRYRGHMSDQINDHTIQQMRLQSSAMKLATEQTSTSTSTSADHRPSSFLFLQKWNESSITNHAKRQQLGSIISCGSPRPQRIIQSGNRIRL